MALSSSTFQIPFLKHRYFGMSQNLRTPILTMSTIPRDRLISSFHTARSKLCSPLRTISCVAGDDETSEASSLLSSISSLFVKGMSDLILPLWNYVPLYLGFYEIESVSTIRVFGFSEWRTFKESLLRVWTSYQWWVSLYRMIHNFIYKNIEYSE